MKKIIANLPDSLDKRLRDEAKKDERTLTYIIIKALEKYLGREK